jgi:tetratricopeptide (TPR) repeat protein
LVYDTCVTLRPTYATGYQFRARAFLDQWARAADPRVRDRFLESALTDFSQAVRLDPSDAATYNDRGSTYAHRHNYDQCIADYSAAIRLHPEEAILYKNRAGAHFERGKYDSAIADYNAAIRLDPKDPTTYTNRAGAFAATGDAARARGDREKAGQLDPKPGNYDARGAALAGDGQWHEAAAAFGQLTEMQPDNPTGWYHLAVAHLGGGDVPGYRRVCALMLERFGATRDPGVASTLLYTSLPRPDTLEPDDSLKQLADLAAGSFKGNVRLAGAVAYRRGCYQEALRYFDEAAKDFAPRPWDWLFLAMAHQRLGHAGEARHFLAKAVAWIDEADNPGAREGKVSGPSWFGWFEPVEVRSLRREAEALLQDAASRDEK